MNFEKKKNFIVNFLFFLICGLIVYLVFRLFSKYLFPFVIGVFVACFVQKPASFLENKFKFKRQYCAAMLSVVVFLLIVFLLFMLVWFLYRQVNDFIFNMVLKDDIVESIFLKINDALSSFFKIENFSLKNIFSETTNSFLQKVTQKVSNFATEIIKKIPITFVSCIVTIVATFYIAKDYEKLKNFLKGIISEKSYKTLIEFKSVFQNCFLKFITGYFWLFLITFFILVVGLFVLKIEHFIFFALIVAIVDILPILGTGIVLLPWSIVMFFQNQYKTGFYIVILYLIIVIIKNYLEPKIVGKQLGINPIFTLIFIFLGLRVGGVIGMLVIPMLLTAIFTYYRNKMTPKNE